MIKFLQLFSVIVICIINKIVCSSPIQNVLSSYYNSVTEQEFKKEWKKYQNAFENAVVSGLQENFGGSAVNIYVAKRPDSHLIAGGFYLTDNVVNVYFFNLVLRELPDLVRPRLKMELPSNYLKLQSKVGRMFVDTTYYVARNGSSVVYAHPRQQKYLSPFSLQQVDKFGKVTIIAEDCLLSGISITSLSGDSVSVGHSPFQLSDCKFTVEISAPNSGAPPVIAPYFPNEPKEKLELILSKPIREELQTKLQGAMYSYVNTTVLFGDKKSKFRGNQEKVFKSYAEFIKNYVSKLNQNTLNANNGHVKLKDYDVYIDTTDKILPSCHLALRDLMLYGLETAYVARTGGPYNDGSEPNAAADAIVFSSMQIRGKITHDDGNGTVINDFAAELTDVTVNIVVIIGKGKTKVHDLLLSGWRSLEFSIIPWETHYRERIGYQSLVYGHILNELPTRVIGHLTSILGDVSGGGGGGAKNTDDDKTVEINSDGSDDGSETEDNRNDNRNDNDDSMDSNKSENSKNSNVKKEFFTDDNLDKNFFTDDALFSDDNIQKDFFTDDNIKKDFFTDGNVKENFFSDGKTGGNKESDVTSDNERQANVNDEGDDIKNVTDDDGNDEVTGDTVKENADTNDGDDKTEERSIDSDNEDVGNGDGSNIENGDDGKKIALKQKTDKMFGDSSSLLENDFFTDDNIDQNFFSDDKIQGDFLSDDKATESNNGSPNNFKEKEFDSGNSANEDSNKEGDASYHDEENVDANNGHSDDGEKVVTDSGDKGEDDRGSINTDASDVRTDDKEVSSDGVKGQSDNSFFTDDNIENNFFTDDNIQKDFFTHDNIDKDFLTDGDVDKTHRESPENKAHVDDGKRPNDDDLNNENSEYDETSSVEKDDRKNPIVVSSGDKSDGPDVKNHDSKKDFFTDDNLEKDFFTDDNLEKDFFTDDNTEKDFFTDDNIEKKFFTDDNLKRDFFSDDITEDNKDNDATSDDTKQGDYHHYEDNETKSVDDDNKGQVSVREEEDETKGAESEDGGQVKETHSEDIKEKDDGGSANTPGDDINEKSTSKNEGMQKNRENEPFLDTHFFSDDNKGKNFFSDDNMGKNFFSDDNNKGFLSDDLRRRVVHNNGTTNIRNPRTREDDNKDNHTNGAGSREKTPVAIIANEENTRFEKLSNNTIKKVGSKENIENVEDSKIAKKTVLPPNVHNAPRPENSHMSENEIH